MSKIGLFYSFNTKNTSVAAKYIQEAFGTKEIEAINVEEATEEEFEKFSKFILGVPTWWDGELPNYWDEFLPSLEEGSMKGKTFAIYGAGDELGYPENFVDAIGLMADFIESKDGKIIGHTPNKGYRFDASKALRGDVFVGLPLDFDNHTDQVETKIKDWVKQIAKEFK